MLLLSGERVRERLHALRPVGVHFGVKRRRDLVNEQSDLLHQIAALFHVVYLQRRRKKLLSRNTGDSLH